MWSVPKRSERHIALLVWNLWWFRLYNLGSSGSTSFKPKKNNQIAALKAVVLHLHVFDGRLLLLLLYHERIVSKTNLILWCTYTHT